jgi:hypothetical protein
MLETWGTSTFTSAQWLQLVTDSLTGTEQQGHSSLCVFIPTLLGALLNANDLFGNSVQYSNILSHSYNCLSVYVSSPIALL